jgi:hypothetical protein
LPFAIGTLLAAWTAQAWLPTIQGLLLGSGGYYEITGITGWRNGVAITQLPYPPLNPRKESSVEGEGFEPSVPRSRNYS